MIYDPRLLLSQHPLRIRQLSGASYVDKVDAWFPEIELGLTIQAGEYDGMEGRWLRWCDHEGKVLATGRELAVREKQRADAEAARCRMLEERLLQLGEPLE